MFGANYYGGNSYGGDRNLVAGLTPDQILRVNPHQAEYHVMVAWGGDLCRLLDSAGASKVTSSYCDGNHTQYDPATDLYDHYEDLTVGTDYSDAVVFDAAVDLNEIVLYFHPTDGYPRAVRVQYSTDGIDFVTVFDGLAGGSKVVVDLGRTVSALQIGVKCYDALASSDGYAHLCAIEAYNWVDESSRIKHESGEPIITITSKGADSLQNSSPDSSSCTITFDNADDRFNPTDSASAIYGVEQMDGAGSGVRSGVPVRVAAIAYVDGLATILGGYRGFITDDNNPGGPSGIQLDENDLTATINCKSFLSILDAELHIPAYTNCFYDWIIRDLCLRCGIAEQDLICDPISNGVGIYAFATGTARSVFDSMLALMPGAALKEGYGSDYQIHFSNTGRERASLSAGYYVSDASIVDFMIPWGKYIFFCHDTGTHPLYKWDTTKPITDEGVTEVVAAGMPDLLLYASVYNDVLYMISLSEVLPDITVYSINLLEDVYTVTNHGQVNPDETVFRGAVMEGPFLFWVATRGGVDRLYIWDTRLAFSTAINKGAIPFSSGADTIQIGAQNGYLVIKEPAAEDLQIWNHASDPLVTALAWVKCDHIMDSATALTNSAFFLRNYSDNTWCYIVTKETDPLGNIKVWRFDIAAGALNTSLEAVFQGYVPDSTGTYEACDPGRITMHGSYLYFATNEQNVFVWDVDKDISYCHKLGQIYNENSSYPPKFYAPLTPFPTYWKSMGSEEHFDLLNRVWLRGYDPVRLQSFRVENVRKDVPVAEAEFYIGDSFTANLSPSFGNPEGNKIIVKISSNTIGDVSTLATIERGHWMRAGETTIFPVEFSSSRRGQGRTTTENRYAVFDGQNVWDDPTYSLNHTYDGVNYDFSFFGFVDYGYIVTVNNGTTSKNIWDTVEIKGKAYTTENDTIYEEKDDASIQLYRRPGFSGEFPLSIDTTISCDDAVVQDLLLNGKIAKLYIDPLELPWYPCVYLGQVFNIITKDAVETLCRVVEYTIDGFKTTVKLKQVPEQYYF